MTGQQPNNSSLHTKNALLLTSIEQTKSNTNCVSESDFTAAILLESCLNLVYEQSNVANNSLFNEIKSTHIGIVTPLILIKNFKLQMCSETVEQGLCSLASWLIKKVSLCQLCTNILSQPSAEICGNFDEFVYAKKYETKNHSVQPSSCLHEVVRVMEAIFTNNINKIIVCKNIAGTIIKAIKKDCNFVFLYNLHPKHASHLERKLIHYFVDIQIYYFIKFYNRDIAPRYKKCPKKMARITHK